MIQEKFAQFVKEKRKQKKIKMKDICDKADVSDSFIYLVEKNVNSPSIHNATRILDSLGESWATFINYTEVV